MASSLSQRELLNSKVRYNLSFKKKHRLFSRGILQRTCQPFSQIQYLDKTPYLYRSKVSKGKIIIQDQNKQATSTVSKSQKCPPSLFTLSHPGLEVNFYQINILARPKYGKVLPEKVFSSAQLESIKGTITLGMTQLAGVLQLKCFLVLRLAKFLKGCFL